MRTVVLRHEMPDGTWHYDWMLERAGGDERRLVTFRVEHRPDQAGVAGFEGHRIRDHRAIYLDHEGEVPGERGTVTRLAQGVMRWVRCDGEVMSVVVEYGSGPLWWIGQSTEGGRRASGAALWMFRLQQSVLPAPGR